MVDKHEFITAAADSQKVATKENIKKAFTLFDTNGDGTIEYNEFKNAFPSFAEDNKHDGHKDNETDDERWKHIMQEFDTNGDG